MKNKNKKKLIILIISIALVVFIALFFIYYYRESSLLTSSDKNWISENGTEMIDIEVFNDVALYGMNGSGVVFDFLDYVTEETELQFNKIPYSKEEGTSGDTYKIEIIDGSQSLNSNQLFLFEDSYVAVGKKSIKINTIADFAGYTLGVLEQEESNISYYLKSASNITYNSYKLWAKGDIVKFDDYLDYNNYNIQASEEFIINNFKIFSPQELDFICLKKNTNKDYYNKWCKYPFTIPYFLWNGLYRPYVYRVLYKQYCDPGYKIPLNILFKEFVERLYIAKGKKCIIR